MKLAKQSGLSKAGMRTLGEKSYIPGRSTAIVGGDNNKRVPERRKQQPKSKFHVSVPRVGKGEMNPSRCTIITGRRQVHMINNNMDINEIRNDLERRARISEWEANTRDRNRHSMQKSYLTHPRMIR